jgi:antitoxin component YwqK of YwqJK toxin-antitoxin module
MKYSDLLLENKAQYKQMMQPLVDSDIVNDADAQQVITSARQVLKRNDRITWYLKWYRVTAIKQKLGSFMGRGLSGDAELASQKEAIDKMYAKAVKGLQMPSTSSVDSQLHNFGRLFMDLTTQHSMHMMSMMEQIPALGDVTWDGSPSALHDKLQAIEQNWQKNSDKEIQVDQYETDAWEVLIDYNGKQGWVLLNMEYCELEGAAMGHCGNKQGRDGMGERILSFRTITSEKHKPHLTFVLRKDGKLGEMKGRANEKPAAKYHAAIIALLKHDIVKGFAGGGHEPENNFSMDDLSDGMSAELIKEKPVLDPSIPVLDIEYYPDGSIEREVYSVNGEIHREDGPALISYSEDGSIAHEEYYINGEIHREDGPALILYHEDGSIAHEEYRVKGKMHREDGPADIAYDEDGSIRREEYYINGNTHREDGPAEISYYEDGSIQTEWYSNNGAAKKYKQGVKFPDKKQNESINRLQQLAGIK